MTSFPSGIRRASMIFPLFLMVIDSARSVSPPHIRLDFTPTIIKRDGNDAATLAKQDPNHFLQLTIALCASFAALSLVLFIYVMWTGGFQRVGRRIRKRVPMHESGQDGGFSTVRSVTSRPHISRNEQQSEWQNQSLGTSGPAPAIMVTPMDPDETLLGRASTEAATSVLSIPATLYTDATLTTAVSPALNVAQSFSQSTPSSSLDAINESIKSSDNVGTSVLEMIPPRAPPGLEHIRTLLMPSPRPISDSMSDHAPSLAEFPCPPGGPLLTLSHELSSPSYSPGDLGDLGHIQSLASSHAESRPDPVDSVPPEPNYASLDDTLSTTCTRPPTCHSGWHRPGLSQSSISTLPAYTVAGEGANTANQASRPRSSRSSTSKQGRATLVQPPLPVPPFPLGFPL